MPWQQSVIDVILEIDPDTGELAYNEFGLTVPRQSGKSTLLLAKAVHRALAAGFFGGRQSIVYTAQTRKDSREKFVTDFAPDLAASSFKNVATPNWQGGAERIKFQNGSIFKIEATTEKAGHGGTLDEAYIDEAFAHVDNRSEDAFRPAMITRRNKQLGVISTAGWSDGSPFLQAKVKAGRAATEMGIRSGLAYFEWSAPEDADPADAASWRDCMPALGHTITEAAIQAEFDRALREGKLNGFRRAYLNQWVPKFEASNGSIFPSWGELADPAAERSSTVCFGVATAPDRARSAVVAAWRRSDGAVHLARAAPGRAARAVRGAAGRPRQGL